MNRFAVPEFAIIGHPNEGKSTVVSTLAEDDHVRISATPGETLVCQRFPVIIDGRETIRFVDTPGFQNPSRALSWMKSYHGPDEAMVAAFRQANGANPEFRDECELLSPIQDGAGIIFVVDGSRPLRNVDRAEIEVLRLTGRPRMAIINCKIQETRYIEPWKNEFRKAFNAVRVFNAHRATYAERIQLLESLKSIDQDWQPALETVITAFQKDWEQRNRRTAELIVELLARTLTFSLTRTIQEGTNEAQLKTDLQDQYNREIEKIEKKTHQHIRKLFKHNIFNVDLPPHCVLQNDLFSEKTWKLLGLTPGQLIKAAAVGGAAIGATADLAVHGISFGIFTAIGGLAGAGWAALGGGKHLTKTRVVGMRLGAQQVRIGPVDNIQFLYILLDRCLIYYSHIINWAHGRRDYPVASPNQSPTKAGIISHWDESSKKACNAFFKALRTGNDAGNSAGRAMTEVIEAALDGLSNSQQPYGITGSQDKTT